MKLETVDLRTLGEKWVQQQIADDPTILGLGDLILKDKERMQARAGRLDLLLQDPETFKRYETEVQLGSTDESHIIRTIEYWDIERKLYPQYEHVAVIIAEEITSRFLNVIQLFNGSIPLIALKVTGYNVGGECALTFVTVVDERRFGLVDDDEPVAEPTDRNFWETNRGSKKSLAITDSLMKVVTEVEPKAKPKYNKHYIGLEVDGSALNFVRFEPRKAHVLLILKLPKTDATDLELEEAGLVVLRYETQWRQYRLRLDSEVEGMKREVLRKLIAQAREGFGKSS